MRNQEPGEDNCDIVVMWCNTCNCDTDHNAEECEEVRPNGTVYFTVFTCLDCGVEYWSDPQ